MLPSITVPLSQALPTATPINLAAVAPVPAQSAANLIYQAVPANSSPVALFNNVRGGSAANLRQVGVEAASAAASGEQLRLNSIVGRFPNLGSNSAFLTQVLSQSSAANDNNVFSQFFYPQPQSLTPDQALLERFAQTKYMPSQAFLPLPSSQGVAPLAQSPATPDAPVAQGKAEVSENPAPGTSQNVSENITSSRQSAAPLFSSQFTSSLADQSLIRRSGFDSYLATFSRNVANLNGRNTAAGAV